MFDPSFSVEPKRIKSLVREMNSVSILFKVRPQRCPGLNIVISSTKAIASTVDHLPARYPS